jgi:hypothetical protein
MTTVIWEMSEQMLRPRGDFANFADLLVGQTERKWSEIAHQVLSLFDEIGQERSDLEIMIDRLMSDADVGRIKDDALQESFVRVS